MTIENQIAELIAQAEPLRALPDVEAEAKGLPAIVDRINELRAVQNDYALRDRINGALAELEARQATVEGADALHEAEQAVAAAEAPARKKPGRKPKETPLRRRDDGKAAE